MSKFGMEGYDSGEEKAKRSPAAKLDVTMGRTAAIPGLIRWWRGKGFAGTERDTLDLEKEFTPKDRR